MKYFIDTEFIEGFHITGSLVYKLFGKRRHHIDLISIAIVAEDGRHFYAISKEYDYNDADAWVKKNVIMPMYIQTVHGDQRNRHDVHNFHKFYGLENKQIAEEIKKFCKYGTWNDVKSEGITVSMGQLITRTEPEFYGYYADYDWVLFCSLFGRMIDLPKGFPMYCRDLKQMLDERLENYNSDIRKSGLDARYTIEIFALPVFERLEWIKKNVPTYPAQENEHNALADAKWNKKLFDFINSL